VLIAADQEVRAERDSIVNCANQIRTRLQKHRPREMEHPVGRLMKMQTPDAQSLKRKSTSLSPVDG